MKGDEHKETSVIGKGTSYFNIFECDRNLLDQPDFMYQRAFMASPVKEGYYQPSPARERYYDKLAKSLINLNVGSDGTINNDKLNQVITQLKSEKEAGHECNILDMTQVDEYMSPGKNKDASTVNDLAYYNLDEYEAEISDYDKKPEARKEPITDTHVCNTSVGTTSVYPYVIVVGIIGRGGCGINQGMINKGTGIIISNVVTDVLTDSRKMILKSDTFPLDSFKSQTLIITLQNEPTLSCNKNVCASSEIGNSRIDHGRIGTPSVNKKIWSEDDNPRVKIDVEEAEKLDTIVQRYPTNEGNTTTSRIEEESLELRLQRLYISGTRPLRQRIQGTCSMA